jgi:kynurenine formamidase
MILISYPLHRNIPQYPGTPAIEYRQFRAMASGDSSDHTMVTHSCHAGTHIDTPRHFCPQGRDLAASLGPVNDFSPAYCIDLPAGPNEPIGPQDLEDLVIPSMGDAQALLIRMGWFSRRRTEPEEYVSDNPWIEESTAGFLKDRCPKLRLLGLDTISLGNIHHRNEGRAAHRAFLCGKRPVLLLEDADLSAPAITGRPLRIRIFPLLIDAVEATPVIALAEPGDYSIGNRKKDKLSGRRKTGKSKGERR